MNTFQLNLLLTYFQIQMTNVTLEGEIIPVSEGEVCILAQVSILCDAKILIHSTTCLQIRSSNEFLQSEWSEPLMIPLFPDKYPDCGK